MSSSSAALMDDSDDELTSEFDSDTQKSQEKIKIFYNGANGLTAHEIINPKRQWRYLVCVGGPYVGLQSLLAHARMTLKKEIKLHREFKEHLNEMLKTRGISVAIATGKVYGRWMGSKEEKEGFERLKVEDEEKDGLIVWPPMVVIMNTHLKKDGNDKGTFSSLVMILVLTIVDVQLLSCLLFQWIGMGNLELLDLFYSYPAVKGSHAYDPHGHHGMSILIFAASSPTGFLVAERLHKNFADQGMDINAWNR